MPPVIEESFAVADLGIYKGGLQSKNHAHFWRMPAYLLRTREIGNHMIYAFIYYFSACAMRPCYYKERVSS